MEINFQQQRRLISLIERLLHDEDIIIFFIDIHVISIFYVYGFDVSLYRLGYPTFFY